MSLARLAGKLDQITIKRRIVIKLYGLPIAKLSFGKIESADALNRTSFVVHAIGFDFDKIRSQKSRKRIIVPILESIPDHLLVRDWIRACFGNLRGRAGCRLCRLTGAWWWGMGCGVHRGLLVIDGQPFPIALDPRRRRAIGPRRNFLTLEGSLDGDVIHKNDGVFVYR